MHVPARSGTALRMLGAAVAAIIVGAAGFGPAAQATPPVYGQQRALVLRLTWAGVDGSGSSDLDRIISEGVNPWMSTASRNLFSGFSVTDPGVLTIAQPALSAPPNQCDNV